VSTAYETCSVGIHGWRFLGPRVGTKSATDYHSFDLLESN